MTSNSVSNPKLTSIAPPPAQPIGTGSPEKWADLEKRWGMKFPSQFMMLIDLYGNGRFADFVGFPSPFYVPTRKGITYEKFIKLRFDGLLWTRENIPHHAFPLDHPTDVFPFGYTDNGGTFFWLKNGSCEEWPIIYMDNGYTKDESETFNIPLWNFLEGWLTGSLIPKFSPPDFFPLPEPIFLRLTE